ncbi:hypothetical protein QYF36_001541 [Acer negundo]|nr:hypothetical protein QYF36_001541 [Acer negundo]
MLKTNTTSYHRKEPALYSCAQIHADHASSNFLEALAQTSLLPDIDLDSDKKHQRFNIWKHSYVKACAAVDQELQQYRKIVEQLH